MAPSLQKEKMHGTRRVRIPLVKTEKLKTLAQLLKKAALILSLPSHAKAVIVAEENMRTVALNRDALLAQANAAAQDMQNPHLMKNAAKRAEQQALLVLQAELTDEGGLGDQSFLEQGMKTAERVLDQAKAGLNRAVQTERAACDTLAQAQAYFDANLGDTDATDAVIGAIGNLQKATDARGKAQQAVTRSRQALTEARWKLDGVQKQAKANVEAQAKEKLEEQRLKREEERARRKEQAGGEDGGLQDGDGLLSLQSVDLAADRVSLLAKNDESGIIEESREQLESDTAKTLPGLGNAPIRALASARAATDVGYDNGHRDFMTPGESLSSSGEERSGQAHGTVDEEIYWRDIQPEYYDNTEPPAQIPTSSTTSQPTPTPKPSAPVYVINLASKGGYAYNKNAYPEVMEETLMPWEYLMQGQAVMVKEEYPYAADQMISGRANDKRSECVGMIRLPGQSWFPSTKSKLLSTTVSGTYNNSTHKGAFTTDMERFNGMQLITKDYKHIVTYYKEFYDGEKMHYNVVVHNAGQKYMKIEEGMTPEEIAAAKAYNEKVDSYNANKHAEIVPFEDAIKIKKYKFQYWCAPDYIDYGDQKIPGADELLTPNKRWK